MDSNSVKCESQTEVTQQCKIELGLDEKQLVMSLSLERPSTMMEQKQDRPLMDNFSEDREDQSFGTKGSPFSASLFKQHIYSDS